MTGGEAIAGALAGAAKEVQRQGQADRALLGELAKDHPATKDAADAFAKRLAIRQGILLRLYQPLAWVFGQRKYFQEDFAEDIARATAHIPEEELRTPLASVAFPAVQGLSYSFEEPSLKEMYLRLLATATDGRRDEDAHPAFAEVIKQLTAAEAGLLRIPLGINTPICEIRRKKAGEGGYNIALRHMTPYQYEDRTPLPCERSAVWIDNWVRLGLVKADYLTHITQPGVYDFAERHPDYLALVESADEGVSYEIQHGVLMPTSFGRRFAAAAITDPSEAERSHPVEADS